MLTPHGHGHPHVYVGLFHSPEEEAQIREGERDIAVQAVEQGYLVIAPTTRAFGKTRSPADKDESAVSSCRLQLMHDLLLGRTPIGDRVWDMSRLIDWSIEHQGVDPARIAITGNSGGGTVSLFAAACDTRISVAVPGCYFNTFAGSIGSIIHCDCNYVPGILRLGEMHDIAGLIAPRHFLTVAGRDDPIFPVAHTHAAFAQLAKVYQTAGAPTAASCTSSTAATATTRSGSGASSRKHSALYEAPSSWFPCHVSPLALRFQLSQQETRESVLFRLWELRRFVEGPLKKLVHPRSPFTQTRGILPRLTTAVNDPAWWTVA